MFGIGLWTDTICTQWIDSDQKYPTFYQDNMKLSKK